ncbi:protein kinase [bacterium]|nr:protein kinase [bacterium]MBU1025765.1 protein kinase [bacterium]
MERFEKIKELGRGATGTVFKSFDNESGIIVALKVPEPPPDGIDVATHYRREIDLLSGLKHDGVVKVISQDLGNGQPWIAYEFIKGHTLRELISSGKKFEPEEALRITAEIAHALEYIHNAGIVHRDVNPNNVMITTDGAVKIMDFGIAHRSGEPYPKQLAGTPGYMSPETAKGVEGGPESDIYSLGLICYELIAGEPVYTGESVPEVIAKVVANDFISLEKKKFGLNERIYGIIEKALASNSHDRYSSANELAREIEMIISAPEKDEKTGDVDVVSAPPKLIGIAGPYKGYEFDIPATITTFGGDYADVDLSLDARIEPQHCWIVPEDGAFWLYDAEDSGGTFMAGRAIKRARLKPGDRITIGNSTFRWEYPADNSPMSRGHDEIEFAAIPHARISSRGDTSFAASGDVAYQKAPATGMPPFARMLTGIVVVAAALYMFYGYIMVPQAETKQIALELENYWVDFNTLMSSNDSTSNILNIVNQEKGLTYENLQNMELVSSVFFNLSGPKKIRQTNLSRIDIVIKTCQALNFVRDEETTSGKKVQVDPIIRSLELIKLPVTDEWENRRLWIVSKLTQITTQLAADAVRENELGTATLGLSGVTDIALEKLLDGYYLISESGGNLSRNLALDAFYDFEDAEDRASKILLDEPVNNLAKVIVILSDYFMARIRVDYIANWERQFIDDSVLLLTEGRNLVDSITDSEYSSVVPQQIEDSGYRNKGRLRAKYIALIDEFERLTGADIPDD